MEAVAKIVAYLIIGAFCVSIAITVVMLLAFLISELRRIFKKKPNAPPSAHSAPPQPAAHDPCDTCVRWGECNGVDEECPRKNVYI